MRHKTLTWLHANLLFFGLAFASVGPVAGCGGSGGGPVTGGFSEEAKLKSAQDLEEGRKAMQGSKDYKSKSKTK